LLLKIPELFYSVSVSTRGPRAAERTRQDYWFVTGQEFEKMLRAGEFLEWAEVFGNQYGTRAEPIERARLEGRDIQQAKLEPAPAAASGR